MYKKKDTGSHRSSLSCQKMAEYLPSVPFTLTLVLLNKLRCHTHFQFSANQIIDPDCCYKFTYLMANSADPNQLASDLDLHCFQRQGIFGISRIRVKLMFIFISETLPTQWLNW